ncbi:MAG: hypothetical protein C4539_04095 [Ignavibacteriales bacterium]|nr:MAG: hypothetical protein C4539_04095 [Ignavibacteriales bacterium]
MELIPIIEYTLLIFIAILAIVLFFSYIANKFSSKDEKPIPAFQNVHMSNYVKNNGHNNSNNYSQYEYRNVGYSDEGYQQFEDQQYSANVTAYEKPAKPVKEITKRFTLLNELNTGLPIVEENKLKIIGHSHGSAAFSNRTVLFK